jgi:hypothetical protein
VYAAFATFFGSQSERPCPSPSLSSSGSGNEPRGKPKKLLCFDSPRVSIIVDDRLEANVPALIGKLLGLPLLLLNLFGGIAAAIWLGTSGHLSTVFVGLVMPFVSIFVFILLFAPTVLLDKAGAKALENGKLILFYIFLVLSNVYVLGIFSVWGYFVFSYFLFNIPENLRLPGVVFSYAIATSPVRFLASKEQENIFTQASALIYHITCVVAMFVAHGVRYDTSGLMIVFAVGGIVSIVLSLVIVRSLSRSY